MTGRRKELKTDLEFKRYMKSGMWRCPAGGAHFWVATDGALWKCAKCSMERQFPMSSYGHGCYWDNREYWRSLGVLHTLARER